MIIQFDPSKMHVQVLCGIQENYAPTEKTEEIFKKVEVLKDKMAKFRDEVLNPELDELNKLVEAHNKAFVPQKA